MSDLVTFNTTTDKQVTHKAACGQWEIETVDGNIQAMWSGHDFVTFDDTRDLKRFIAAANKYIELAEGGAS